MIAKKITFSMVFGQSIPGFAMTPDSIEYYPGHRPADADEPHDDTVPPDQHYELTIAEGGKGVLRSEHGCQKIDDIVESEFSVSFTAYAGSEGVEIFRYVLMLSDSTAQCVGFCCGIKPFFRSFMPLKGTVVE